MDTIAAKRSFASLSLSPETLRSLEEKGYEAAHPRAGGDDPPRAGRQGPRRAVADRHRQDRGLRHPDRREGRRGAPGRAGGRPRAHARAGHPGGAGDRRARARARGQGPVGLRRRLDGAADRGDPRRRPRDRGHPGPRARPPAPRDARLLGRALPRARRGGPHARHGLRGRDGPDHGVRAGRAADDALLGHGADRDPRPHLPLHGRARVGAPLRGPDLRQGGRAPLLPDLAAAQGGDALPAPRVRERLLLDDLLQHPRGDAPRRHLPAQPGPRRRHALLRPAAEEARAGHGRLPLGRDPSPGHDRRGLPRDRHRGPLPRLHLLDPRLARAVHPPRRPHRAGGQERPRDQPDRRRST